VVDQLRAFNGEALIKNVFTDGAWRADAALGGDVAQLAVQILLTQGCSLSGEGRRQQNGSGGTIRRSMKLSWFSDWWFDQPRDCAFSGGEL